MYFKSTGESVTIPKYFTHLEKEFRNVGLFTAADSTNKELKKMVNRRGVE
jgi:hypothetical protein